MTRMARMTRLPLLEALQSIQNGSYLVALSQLKDALSCNTGDPVAALTIKLVTEYLSTFSSKMHNSKYSAMGGQRLLAGSNLNTNSILRWGGPHLLTGPSPSPTPSLALP